MIKIMVPLKGLVTRNVYVQYRSPISYRMKDMAKVYVFQKYVKLQEYSDNVKLMKLRGRSCHE